MTDLAVLLAILGFAFAVLFPAAACLSRRSIRSGCFNNLKQIGMAMLLYSGENKALFPRTAWRADLADSPARYTGARAANPFGPGGPAPNDVTAALFLLVRTQDITGEVFICPSTEVPDGNLRVWNFDGGNPQQFSNFPSGGYLSYSLANPYPSQAAVNLGYKWNCSLPPEFAIAADMNPGSAELRSITLESPPEDLSKANSRNHGGAGQNVLYADGHVEWQNQPFCGARRDNIYTVSLGEGQPASIPTPTVSGSPSWALDSVLLPVCEIDPLAGTGSPLLSPWSITILIAALATILIPISALLRRRFASKPR